MFGTLNCGPSSRGTRKDMGGSAMLPMCDHANTVRFFCRNLCNIAHCLAWWICGGGFEATKRQAELLGSFTGLRASGEACGVLDHIEFRKMHCPMGALQYACAQKHIFPIIRISFLLLIAETHCCLTLDADDMLLIRQGKTF